MHTRPFYYIIILFGLTFLNTVFSENRVIAVPGEYATIQDALLQAKHGDTVFVKSGRYKESITMPNSVALVGENPDNTIIVGNGRDPVIRAANYSIVKNFTVTRGGMGVLSENTNMVIQNNIIKDNRKTGIQCILSLPQIQNNIIANNAWSGIFCELVSYGARTAIENNIIAQNGYTGVTMSQKSGILVQNNIFFENNQYGVSVSPNSRKSRIIYNNFYNNRKNYNSYAVIDATNISVDPKFPSNSWSSFEKIASYRSPTNSSGKNGSPIGIVQKGKLNDIYKDIDEDKIPDHIDACPDVAEDYDGFEDDDGCPEKDNDGDGIYDNVDRCPNQLEDFDGFEDRDGCPDIDNDNDKIPDHSDKCPNRPEILNGYKDSDGCPDMAPKTE